jgi:hypothetical protein
MQTTQQTLFENQRTQRDHEQTVRLLLGSKPCPEGGPPCICGPQAIRALQAGVPAPCADMPWTCPFGNPQNITPTV